MKSVIFLTREIPRPNMAGHLNYMYAIVRFLEMRGHEITILLTKTKVPFLWWNFGRYYLSGHTRIAGKGLVSAGGWCWASIPGLYEKIRSTMPTITSDQSSRLNSEKVIFDEVIGEFPSESEMRYTVRKIDVINPDYVFFDTVFLAPIADRMRIAAQKIVVTHDVFHKRWQSLTARGYSIGPAEFARDTESSLLNRFDVIIAIQNEDEKLFKEMAPGRDVITAPMPVTPNYPADRPRIRGRCIFVGSDGLVNADGLRWFTDKVWPAVFANVPEAELHVHGLVCSMVSESDIQGITLHGLTRDLTEPYLTSSVAIAPLRAGSGLKIKLIEYLSFGLPCVTTSVGAAGFLSGDHMPFLIADDETAFAEKVTLLLVDYDLRSEMQRKALEYCLLYTSERVFQQLERHVT